MPSYNGYTPGIGGYHLSLANPRRVVPGSERHRWDKKYPAWGESTTCTKCGCQKHRRKTQPDYTEVYQMPGGPETRTRPACTGQSAPTSH